MESTILLLLLRLKVGILFSFLFSASIYAQSSVILTPVQDNTLYEHPEGALSNGAGAYLFAGNSGQDLIRRALLAFDVAGAITSDAKIDSVRLTLTMSRTISGQQTIAIHRVVTDWGEGESVAGGNQGGGGQSMDNDATWLHTFYDTLSWNTAGGDFAADTSAVLVVEDIDDYAVASSDGLADDARAWLAHPAENFGWILIGDESETSTAKRFNSREHDDAATHPSLEVFYSMQTAREDIELPELLRVYPNYPNPFGGSTFVTFDLESVAQVQLDVVDLLGRTVWQSPARTYPAGPRHGIEIDGASLAAGVYVYRLTLQGQQETRSITQRMVVAR